MFKILLSYVFSFLILVSFASAEESDEQAVKSELLSKGSRFLEEKSLAFLPSGSTSEFALSGTENSKPIGHFVFVMPMKETNNGVFFNQTQLNNYFLRGDDRQALNLGFGYRHLSDDNKYFLGVNTFYDVDSEKNQRASLGLEFHTTPFSANANVYQKLSSPKTVGTYTETVVGGHDIKVSGQIPWLPWASVNYTSYEWDKVNNSKSSKGDKISGKFYINNFVTMEVGTDNNNIDLSNGFASVMFSYPPHNKPSLLSKPFTRQAFEASDVRRDLLMKVKRTNRLVVESANVGVVMARLD